MKTCTKCGETKPYTEFHRGNPWSDGYRTNCKECRKEESRKRYLKHGEKIRQQSRESNWKKRFPYKHAANERKRVAAKLNATPEWLTGEHLKEIENLYWLARDLKLVSGEEYHVDHILPLRGENVCGLHVPWNLQILSAKENLQKSNKVVSATQGG